MTSLYELLQTCWCSLMPLEPPGRALDAPWPRLSSEALPAAASDTRHRAVPTYDCSPTTTWKLFRLSTGLVTLSNRPTDYQHLTTWVGSHD